MKYKEYTWWSSERKLVDSWKSFGYLFLTWLLFNLITFWIVSLTISPKHLALSGIIAIIIWTLFPHYKIIHRYISSIEKSNENNL